MLHPHDQHHQQAFAPWSCAYAGGNFAITGATPRNNAAAFSAVTGALTGWVPNINGNVTALAADGNLIYVGGGFSQVAGQPRTGIVAVDADKRRGQLVESRLIRGANAIEIASDGAVIVGGGANATGGVARFNLAAIDMVSGQLLAPSPATNGTVMAMVALEDEGALIIGGSFTNVNGQPRNRLAVLDEDGDVDDFNSGADNTINALAVANGRVYVGGAFGTIAGQPRARLASFSIEQEGALTDWPWTGGRPGSVMVLEPGDGWCMSAATSPPSAVTRSGLPQSTSIPGPRRRSMRTCQSPAPFRH